MWCDDIAARRLARTHNIETFGTFALYQVLTSDTGNIATPRSTEMKMRLLRARIADVPISLSELAWATDDSDGADIAVGVFLGRPHVWNLNPSEALTWYRKRMRTMTNSPHRKILPDLLYEACRGYGAAAHESDRIAAIGGLLAVTMFDVYLSAMTPVFVAASRYAAFTLEPRLKPDPLPAAVQSLLSSLEPTVGTALATQMIMRLFSEAPLADRLSVASIVLGNR